MAKAKKSEGAASGAAQPAAKKSKPAGKKQAAKNPAAPAGGTPLIDTALAAETAARFVGNKLAAQSQATPPAEGEKKESAAFKQMKESLTKPHAASVGNLLANTMSPAAKRSGHPFGGFKQVGHNQTFGADVTRSGVPRRTPG